MNNKTIPIVWTGEKKSFSLTRTLVKENESIKVLGVLIGSDKDKFKLNTTLIHSVPRTTSNVIIRGVLKGSARVDYTGLIKINKGSFGANGFLQIKILLFDEASGAAVPSLEINENDVKAGHAATVGQVNEEELFYLESRGLTQGEATRLIIQGFFEPVIKEFPREKQKKLRERILNKLCLT